MELKGKTEHWLAGNPCSHQEQMGKNPAFQVRCGPEVGFQSRKWAREPRKSIWPAVFCCPAPSCLYFGALFHINSIHR